MNRNDAVPQRTRQLTHLGDIRPRIGTFAIAPLSSAQIDAALGVLKDQYGPDLSPDRLEPPSDADALRAGLARHASQLIELANEMREALEGDYSALIVPSMGLAHLPLHMRSALLFALSVGLGTPTATDKVHRRVVWDVKMRDDKISHNGVSTFSEHSYEAELHTDTQYFDHPERYMMLYIVAPANCGGGISSIRALQCLREELSATPEGRWAMDYLTDRDVPFRVPSAFTRDGGGDRIEFTFAPIFAQRPAIRYRFDTLQKGLEAHPELDVEELRRALSVVNSAACNQDRLVTRAMPADSLQLLNNHEALHGRSSFTDRNRHVLRIRMAEAGVLS